MLAKSRMAHLTKAASTLPLRPLTLGISSRPHLRLKATQAATVPISHSDVVKERQPLPFSEVPGPRRWPFLGSVPAMVTNKLFNMERLPRLWASYFKEYGPIFRLTLPGQGDAIYLAEPKDIEHMMRSTQDDPLRPFMDSLRMVREAGGFFTKGQTGILTEQSEEWWRVRRLVQPYMMKPKMVVHYLPQMDEVALEFIDRLAKSRDDKMELPGDLVSELLKWSLESVCLVTLNRRMGCFEGHPEGLKINETSQKMFAALAECEYGFHWWKFVETKAFRRLREADQVLSGLAMDAIDRAQETLEAKAKGGGDGELNLVEAMINTPSLSYKDIVAYLTDFFLAAADTTSMTLMFTLYSLALNPNKQADLQKELDQVLGRDPTIPITPEKLGRLPYTKACVKESLRMFAVAGFVARTLNKDVVLAGYHIPKGTIVFGSQFEAGQNAEVFPEPEKFLPERWVRGADNEGIAVTNKYASIPFSMGTRMCIGNRIALQEVHVLLARLFQRYNLSYKYKAWDPLFKTLLIPDQPQNFTLTER